MGNPNLMREEACVMRKRSERSFVLFAMIFVFSCLLLSGGSRLIGHEEGEHVQLEDVSPVRAAFSAAPAPQGEMGLAPSGGTEDRIAAKAKAPGRESMPARVVCDANGNVPSGASYLRAVYQAFSLGDGFV